MPIKKILVPTDFSAASTVAISEACALADSLGASLCILHALEMPYEASPYTDFYALPQDFFDRLVEQAQHDLDATLTAGEKTRYHATLILRRGNAAQQILAYLQEHDVDLVVMATHGRGGVARLMMGSVADKVVRAAPCAVLTIRPGDVARPAAGQAARRD